MAVLKYRNPDTGEFEELIIPGGPGPTGPSGPQGDPSFTPGPPGPTGLGLGSRTIITKTVSGLIVAALADNGGYLRFTGTLPTYQFPIIASVPIPVGAQIDGISVNSSMTIVGAPTVVINTPRSLVTVGPKSAWSAVKVADDVWDVMGDFI